AIGGMMISSCATSKYPSTPPDLFTAPKIDPVRIGFVGVGGMGTAHVRNFIRIEGVEIKALCDIVEDHAKRSQKMVVEAGQPEPEIYTRDEYDFKRMCERDDLDLVFTATPWKWHVPVVLEAMNTGKHAATEVPAAYTIDDCWQMVETSENTQKYCIMMENCCYGRREMMLLNMVRKGLFGELMHGECGYLHDLRGVKFSDGGEGLWRREHAKTRNGNLYPTHGLGPLAQRMNINRGDRFEYLVSMSSPSRGLQLYAEANYPADHPKRQEEYVLGDVNVCLIRTVNGKTLTLYHDCNLPRPYSRGDLVQGTRGIAHGYPDRIYIEGVSETPHQWEELDKYRGEYEHPLWTEQGERARGAGHGGMDFIEDYRLIECLRNGEAPDLDVYDAAAWSVICELSEISVANKSKSVDFPDFTRGAWKTREPLAIVGA
ncbi:Gfo/Idh/MocA family protein, partial [candidate division KSB1 bacterium]